MKNLNKQNKTELIFCFAVTFILGLAAHLYAFMHSMFSHDSLNAFVAGTVENQSKISVGRFMVPVIRSITRGSIALPWVIGFLALIYVSLSVFLIIKIFNVKSKIGIILISGIMATNVTVSASAATFIHELDINMFALLLSCTAVYFWQKNEKILWLISGVVLLTLSLGIYQSYFQVAITLMIMASIINLLDGKNFREVFIRGLKGIAMLIVSGILYFVSYNLVLKFSKIELNDRVNVLSSSSVSFMSNIKMFLFYVVNKIISPCAALPSKAMGIINIFLILFTLFLVVYNIFKLGKNKAKEKILALILCALIPLAVDIISFFVDGVVHTIMIYSFWFVYVFSVVIFTRNSELFNKKNIINNIAFLLVGIFVWNNILIANTCYLKKDFEQTATLSVMTRVIDDMEDIKGYIPGKTKVKIFGDIDCFETPEPFKKTNQLFGMDINNTVGNLWGKSWSYCAVEAYFRYYLNYPINFCDDIKAGNPEVKSMPCYPDKGYIKIIDNTVVVKLGSVSESDIQSSC